MLMDLQPHKVSKNLRGYSILFFGDPKSGKTTIASKFPKSLIVAFEKGYAALPGVFAQPINNWAEFIILLRELESPEVQEKFETIVIDTADISYDYVEKHICAINGVSNIKDIPFGAGYKAATQLFDEALRKIIQLNYGLVIISHAQDKTFTAVNGVEYNKIVPTLANKPRLICNRMCDIIGYSRPIDTDEGIKTYLFMRGTPRIEAGSRFKYTPDKIEFTYDNLVKAIADAIDKQAAEGNGQYVTEEAENVYLEKIEKLDFDETMNEIKTLITAMMEKNSSFYAPRITEIIENQLGIGKKVFDCTRTQISLLGIIVQDLRKLATLESPAKEEK